MFATSRDLTGIRRVPATSRTWCLMASTALRTSYVNGELVGSSTTLLVPYETRLGDLRVAGNEVIRSYPSRLGWKAPRRHSARATRQVSRATMGFAYAKRRTCTAGTSCLAPFPQESGGRCGLSGGRLSALTRYSCGTCNISEHTVRANVWFRLEGVDITAAKYHARSRWLLRDLHRFT